MINLHICNAFRDGKRVSLQQEIRAYVSGFPLGCWDYNTHCNHCHHISLMERDPNPADHELVEPSAIRSILSSLATRSIEEKVYGNNRILVERVLHLESICSSSSQIILMIRI
jgi:hypothetical protein